LRSGCFLFCPCGADGPRGAGGRSARSDFFPCSSCSCSASLSIHFGFEFWSEVVSDSLQQRADGPRVPGGQSACSPRTVRYSRSSLVVRFGFSDGLRRRAGQSVVRVRTVRGSRPDGPRGVASADGPVCFASWFDSSLPFSCFRVCFKESFLRLEVDP
jgi:hypothetical protein